MPSSKELARPVHSDCIPIAYFLSEAMSWPDRRSPTFGIPGLYSQRLDVGHNIFRAWSLVAGRERSSLAIGLSDGRSSGRIAALYIPELAPPRNARTFFGL